MRWPLTGNPILDAVIATTPKSVDLPGNVATPIYNVNQVDQLNFPALAIAITSMTTGLRGTPIDAQTLVVRILDDGAGPYAIAWGAKFADRGATLPTVTVSNKTLYVGLIYNDDADTFDCVASLTEA